MSELTGKAFDLKLFKRVFGFVKAYQKAFYFTAILTIAMSFLAPIRTLLIQKTLDDYIQVGNEQGLVIMCLIILGVLVLSAVFQFIQTYLANYLGEAVIRDMRVNAYHKIINYKLRFFDQTPIGSLVTRVTSDMQAISEIFSSGILIIISDLLQLILVVVTMMYINVELTLITIIPIPLLIWATNIFKNKIKLAFQEVRKEVSRLNVFVQEHVSGMSLVQVFNRQQKEFEKFKKINESHKAAHIKTVWANSIFFPVVEILSALSLALLVWWGTKGALQGKITQGEILAFILLIHMLFRPIRQLADRFNTLQMGMVAAERVFKVLDENAYIEDNGDITHHHIKGEISFKNVWFAYDDETFILKDVSFEVKPGEKIAIVGATGAGKSSIINILSRFYEFDKGEILLDGQSIRDYNLMDLRQEIGVVLQDVFLFSDSILNNITFGDPNIKKEDVIAAAKAVGAHDFIARLPGGYDYNVKERGALLSVGQRQLISFIRAYVFNPKILVLDEATSSIDTETEELIQQATEKLTEGRTSIIIAHRLATVNKADKIIVLDQGEIVEMGTREKLLQIEDGFFKRLHDYQFNMDED